MRNRSPVLRRATNCFSQRSKSSPVFSTQNQRESAMLPFVLIICGLLSSGHAFQENDYKKVLELSLLFYKAQRSGKLPDNDVAWRGDSALEDKVVGGYYDAGDHVKFNFPMAGMTTILAWGLIEYEQAYKEAGQYQKALGTIKWATDYFMKCYNKNDQTYLVQIGDPKADHEYWGRPEDMKMNRPAYFVSRNNPGSDVAAETASALAAASIVFHKSRTRYSNKLRNYAEQLYNFAKANRGKYSDSVWQAQKFYGSSRDDDELAFAAAWLSRVYKGLGDTAKANRYLGEAKQHIQVISWNPWAFSWDEKTPGVQMLLYQLGVGNAESKIRTFLNDWLPGGSVPYTPKGLVFRNDWAPLRYAGNTAFLATMACKENMGRNYCDFAKKQIDYMLGSGGRSYVVGFGENYPKRPHHRGSSCPDKPAPCGKHYETINAPNPQIIKGALVGGPNNHDVFDDDRTKYQFTEVALDYNAGFQSAVAGLVQLNL